jgi:hypothetical protein
MLNEMSVLKIDPKLIIKRENSLVLLWKLSTFFIDTSLTDQSKKETANTIYKNLFHETLDSSPFSFQIYTDASKTNTGVGISIIYNALSKYYRLSDQIAFILQNTWLTSRLLI